METRKIVDAFSVKREGEEALILKILDTIENHTRRTELKLSYREIKFIYDEFVKDQKKLVKNYIEEYCDEENEKNKANEDFKKLDSESIQRVPPHKMSQYRKDVESLMDADIDIRTPLKFTEKEIKESKILFSEEMLIDDFIIPTKVAKSKKKVK